jgi:hypothetical protein
MFSFSLEPQVDNALFKTNAKNAKDSAQIADKCNDPAASWLRPVEELGMKRISHFWVENCAVRYAKAGRHHVRFRSKADIALHQRMSAMGQTDITVVICLPTVAVPVTMPAAPLAGAARHAANSTRPSRQCAARVCCRLPI